MTRARFGVKVFGLCLVAVLGIASGAQASWLVGSGTLSGEKALKVSAHTHITLLVPSKGLEILCATATARSGSKINSSSLTFILYLIELSNCTTFQSGKESAVCKIKEPSTLWAKGQLLLHNGEEYLLIEGEEVIGEIARLARIDYPESCALPDTNVSGSLTYESLTTSLSSTGNWLEHLVTHLVREVNLGLGAGLLYGVNPATVDGIFRLELVSGEAWSGHV